MLTPRSFLFSRPQAPDSPSPRNPKYNGANSTRRNRPAPITSDKAVSDSGSETDSRPTTPTSPVVIPTRGTRDATPKKRPEVRAERHYTGRKQSQTAQSERRTRDTHSPDAIPPSVAALLAMTAIPPPRSNNNNYYNSLRKSSSARQRLTVDSILEDTSVSEKDLSMSLGRGPLDFLLSSPDEEDDDDTAGSETGAESVMSTRTTSSDVMPSLDGSVSSSPSYVSVSTPGSRGRKSLPTRRMQPVSSPPGGSVFDDPLSGSEIDLDSLDFRVFQRSEEIDEEKSNLQRTQLPKRKSAFKSNLTASLKALRTAAMSFSTLTTPMVTPDDFLTRSIISIDPRVPFTDERMPPRLEDTPTPALRRYLNPTTNAPIEAHVPASLAQTMSATTCTASIQMQTYKVSRSGQGSSPSVISRRTQTTPMDAFTDVAAGPLARQRDMRENSDFIRVAVLEMAMRKKGKLDDQKPGRARWALPPRKPSTKPYEIGQNGIPVRWVAVTY
jgi:hypothetical protein